MGYGDTLCSVPICTKSEWIMVTCTLQIAVGLLGSVWHLEWHWFSARSSTVLAHTYLPFCLPSLMKPRRDIRVHILLVNLLGGRLIVCIISTPFVQFPSFVVV